MNKVGKFIATYIRTSKLLFILLAAFLLFRLINVTLLPMWNDEAIYLDWGWRETHVPGFLYLSLSDAKQPLEFWLFGIAENFISDPLFAGRLVSILFGCATWWGLFMLGKQLGNKKVGLLAAGIYTIIPLFSFYDRQALVEGAVAAIGVWSIYLLLKTILEDSKRYAIALGIVLGIGFFIKSTVLIFALLTCLFILFHANRKVGMGKAINLVFRVLLAMGIVDGLLIINPEFWQTLPSNSRYVYTISELLHFPVLSWGANIYGTALIMLYAITPFVLVLAGVGIWKEWKGRSQFGRVVVLWFVITLGFEMLVSRGATERYLDSFLPLICLFAAIAAVWIINKKNIIWNIGVGTALLIPLAATLLQLFMPTQYLLLAAKIPYSSTGTYLSNYTGGIGVPQVIAFLQKKKAEIGPMFVGFAENAGNPESAINVYFQNDSLVTPSYLDLPQSIIDKYDCVQPQHPLYFVSRGNYLSGLNKFLVPVEKIKNPYDPNGFIGIYALKNNCPPSKTGYINLGLQTN